VDSAESLQPWKANLVRSSILRRDGAEILTVVPTAFSIVHGVSQLTPSTRSGIPWGTVLSVAEPTNSYCARMRSAGELEPVVKDQSAGWPFDQETNRYFRPCASVCVFGAEILWMVPEARASIAGRDLGPLGPLAEPATLGDFPIPQRGVLMFGGISFEAYSPERHLPALH